MADLPTMSEEDKYLFDLQGFLVVRGVLDAETLKTLHASMDVNGIAGPEAGDISKSRFGNFLSWGEPWRNLIDHARIMPYLSELLGPKFRLDHAYGMAAKADTDEGHLGLHHQAGMFNHACYYATHGQQMHTGLLVVSYTLVDMPVGRGGFCCIPGSHKALYNTPGKYYRTDNNPLLTQVPIAAGDVIIFTEALTHGTTKWRNPHERRSVLLKYCPPYMQFSGSPMNSDIPGLTERQRLIMAGPRIKDRPALS